MFWMNGWGPLPPVVPPGSVVLGGVVLSGVQTTVFSYADYLPEHQIPGREGGIVERFGSQLGVVKLHGFADSSGAEILLSTLQGYRGTIQSLSIHSTASGYLFFSGVVNVDSMQSYPGPGYGYPFYYWRLEGKVSGALY